MSAFGGEADIEKECGWHNKNPAHGRVFGFLLAGAGWTSRLTPLSRSRRFYPMLRIGAPRLAPASLQVQNLLITK